MECDICGEKKATVHLTEIINGKILEMHLCIKCAKERQAETEEHLGLSDFLAGLVDVGKPSINKNYIAANLKCRGCGFTYDDFQKIGRLGCGQCYTSFKKQLIPLLKRIHGANKHGGSMPIKPGKDVVTNIKIRQLKKQLQQAIQKEEFEEAAKIRDQIREIE